MHPILYVVLLSSVTRKWHDYSLQYFLIAATPIQDFTSILNKFTKPFVYFRNISY